MTPAAPRPPQRASMPARGAGKPGAAKPGAAKPGAGTTGADRAGAEKPAATTSGAAKPHGSGKRPARAKAAGGAKSAAKPAGASSRSRATPRAADRPARTTSTAGDRGRASTRPGRSTGAGRGGSAGHRVEPARPFASAMSTFSRRMLLLAGVVVIAAAVVLPSLRAYFGQQEELAALRAEREAAQEELADLQGQAARWEDPAFVIAQARERLRFAFPGETPYQVIDPETVVGTGDGEPTEAEVEAARAEGTWYSRLWGSFADAAAEPEPTAAPAVDPSAAPDPEPVGTTAP